MSKIKEDKKWLIDVLQNLIESYKKIDDKKHNHNSRIKLLEKTIKFLEK